MSKIGYERCSTVDQNPKRQEELLKALGCDKVFLDMMSGKDMERPQLKAMMDYVREGDTVYVESISRLARSTKDLLYIVEQLTERGVQFISEKEKIDTKDVLEKLYALLEDRKIIEQLHTDEVHEHSQTLMPLLKNMMDKQQLQVKDVDLLACSEGPGSFTGIRIGMATIKAFSDACNKPVTGISSLEALAYEVIEQKGRKDCKILSMIDARNDNVYFSVYRIKNGNLSVYKNPDVMSISDVVEYVNFVEPLYIIGDVFKEKLEPLLRAKISKEQAQARDVVQHEYINSTGIMAGAIGLAAFDKYDIGDYGDSDEIMPMYLRRPQAE